MLDEWDSSPESSATVCWLRQMPNALRLSHWILRLLTWFLIWFKRTLAQLLWSLLERIMWRDPNIEPPRATFRQSFTSTILMDSSENLTSAAGKLPLASDVGGWNFDLVIWPNSVPTVVDGSHRVKSLRNLSFVQFAMRDSYQREFVGNAWVDQRLDVPIWVLLSKEAAGNDWSSTISKIHEQAPSFLCDEKLTLVGLDAACAEDPPVTSLNASTWGLWAHPGLWKKKGFVQIQDHATLQTVSHLSFQSGPCSSQYSAHALLKSARRSNSGSDRTSISPDV